MGSPPPSGSGIGNGLPFSSRGPLFSSASGSFLASGFFWTGGGFFWTGGGFLWTGGGFLWTGGSFLLCLICISEYLLYYSNTKYSHVSNQYRISPLVRFINASSQRYITLACLFLIGGDGCGLASSTTLNGTTSAAGAASSGGGFAATRRGGGFAATSAGLVLTGFRHCIYYYNNIL